MSDDNAGDVGGGDEGEIGEGTVVGVAHVHATVEHDLFASDLRHHATLSHLLPRP